MSGGNTGETQRTLHDRILSVSQNENESLFDSLTYTLRKIMLNFLLSRLGDSISQTLKVRLVQHD